MVESKAKEKYSLSNWLPDAAKRAGQLAISSHPPKFSHPSIKKEKISAVIANSQRKEDGFLRTGNAHADLDVFGNAAALDVLTFLSLKLSDGQTVLIHLEQDSETIKSQFNLPSVPFIELQQDLLAIKQASTVAKTSEKIKQVYFPVDDRLSPTVDTHPIRLNVQAERAHQHHSFFRRCETGARTSAQSTTS